VILTEGVIMNRGSAIALLILVVLAVPSAALAADALTGAWQASPAGEGLRLQVQARAEGRATGFAFDVPFSELQGLAPASRNGSPLHFRLSRSAGSFDFDGTSQGSGGSGRVKFTPAPAFLADLGRLGYSTITADQLLQMAAYDFDADFVATLKRSSRAGLPPEQLSDAVRHAVTPSFYRGMSELGYADLTTEQLIQMRVFGLTPEYVREMASLGFTGLTADQLVRFRQHGISAEYIRALQAAEPGALSAEQVIELRMRGVDPEHLRPSRREG
jgi:hypothetical protein